MPVNRRQFLQQTALTSGALIASSSLLKATTLLPTESSNLLTVLHTNDVHSRLEPFPMDGSGYKVRNY
jgi:5'-nucleotidase